MGLNCVGLIVFQTVAFTAQFRSRFGGCTRLDTKCLERLNHQVMQNSMTYRARVQDLIPKHNQALICTLQPQKVGSCLFVECDLDKLTHGCSEVAQL